MFTKMFVGGFKLEDSAIYESRELAIKDGYHIIKKTDTGEKSHLNSTYAEYSVIYKMNKIEEIVKNIFVYIFEFLKVFSEITNKWKNEIRVGTKKDKIFIKIQPRLPTLNSEVQEISSIHTKNVSPEKTGLTVQRTHSQEIPSADPLVQGTHPTPNVPIVKKNNSPASQFIEKIEQSRQLKRARYEDQETNQIYLINEIDRYLEFLQTPSPIKHDLIYVCIGAGDSFSQILPGFVFDFLEKEQVVKTIMFENSHLTLEGHVFYSNLKTLYDHSYKKSSNIPQEKAIPVLPNLVRDYEFHQFLCGYPDLDQGVLEDLAPDGPIKRYETAWPKKKRDKAVDALKTYLQKELEAGKKVVIGDHKGGLTQNDVALYNELVAEFPGKVHFLHAWGKLNLMISESISQEAIKVCYSGETSQAPWTYYKNLGECLIK
jgi:hypothetical protein